VYKEQEEMISGPMLSELEILPRSVSLNQNMRLARIYLNLSYINLESSKDHYLL
jgi:hypothetical protein